MLQPIGRLGAGGVAPYLEGMGPELEVLEEVTSRLERAGIAYMLSGSMALNHYAQPRMTRDMDLVVDLGPEDAARVVELFQDAYEPDPDEIQSAIARRRMFNLIHSERVVKVDMIVRKDSPYRIEEFRRRRRVQYGPFSLWIVAPEDLVLSKLEWAKESHSDFQLRDVRTLLNAVPKLEWTYVERWASELGVAALLDEVRP